MTAGPEPFERSRRVTSNPSMIGELHVEQHDVRMQAACGRDRGLAVLGLAADLEPVRLEDRAGTCPETRVVVDDQHGWHKHIVAQESARR